MLNYGFNISLGATTVTEINERLSVSGLKLGSDPISRTLHYFDFEETIDL